MERLDSQAKQVQLEFWSRKTMRGLNLGFVASFKPPYSPTKKKLTGREKRYFYPRTVVLGPGSCREHVSAGRPSVMKVQCKIM